MQPEMEKQNKKSFFSFTGAKRFLPLLFLVILTVVLMIFFKQKKPIFSHMFEEGKKNLLSFYSQNLKPLLFQTKISEEDLFNFALYRSIPLDKEKNKVLFISNDEPGNQIFEIKPAVYNPNTQNYKTFVQYLGMTKIEKAKSDSILNSYKDKIYSYILVGNENSFAVNPQITEVQQAVLADLITFAHTVNENKCDELFKNKFNWSDKRRFKNVIASGKEVQQNEYYLITPDTVAKTRLKWDQKKLDMKLKELNGNNLGSDAAKDRSDFNFKFDPVTHVSTPNAPAIPKDFSFKIDSNLFKIVIPSVALNGLSKLIEDTVRQKLNEAADQIKKLSISFGKIKPKMKVHPNSSASPSAGFDLNLVNPYDIVNQTLKMISNGNAKGWEEFGKKIDSLSRLSNKTNKDSLRRKIREEILKMKSKKLPVNSDDDDDDK
jgi:hypothetical protein